MMRELSTLSERKQDELYCMVLRQITEADLMDLFARLYLSPVSGEEILLYYPNYKFASEIIFKLREYGLKINLRSGKYSLVGIEDGIEKPAMHFSNRYAPSISVRQ